MLKNVLSLFDGMSCGQLALQRAGIQYENYFASEIDKHAIAVTQHNFPNTVQLGDVRYTSDISCDLLLAGSPCQGFSFAGKQLNFDDPRSALFFEFIRILKESEPKYFLLENVNMKQEYQDVITSYLGVSPIRINSADFSAQDRLRLYWTNIPIPKLNKYCSDTLENILNYNVIRTQKYYIPEESLRIIIENEVSKGKISISYDHLGDIIYHIHGIPVKVGSGQICTFPCLTPGRLTKRQNGRRFKPPQSKFYTLTAQDIHGALINGSLRYLTPEEYEKLQTVPVGYTSGVADRYRYKMLGNGWTVDVIAHILKGLK